MTIEARPHPAKRHVVFALVMAGLSVVFIALGTWQVQRLFWKLDLIDRVNTRVHAAPVPAPAPHTWPAITAANYEYRHVTARGTFDHSKETFVQAVTELGPGFWVLTPLTTPEGQTILVNRGFVPADRRDPATRAGGQTEGMTSIAGLLRMSEPGGGFLRANDPAGDRWYSRDVAAIAEAKGLKNVAPYFIDVDKISTPGGYPAGGLTVIKFRNSHLVYAITWYTLAVMSIAASFFLLRRRKTD